MPNIISRSYFERTDFGSTGWIDKVVEALWEEVYSTGIQSQTLSFRSSDFLSIGVHHYTQPQIGWLAGILDLGLEDVTHFGAAWDLQSSSFRSVDIEDVGTGYYSTYSDIGWLSAVLDLWEHKWFPAISSQSDSFRSEDSEKLGGDHLADFRIGWLKVPAGILDLDPIDVIAAICSSINLPISERQRNKTAYQQHDQPLPNGWIAKVTKPLFEVQDFFPAWSSQSKSFRSEDMELLNPYYQTKLDFSWLSTVLSLVDVGVLYLGTKSLYLLADGRIIKVLPDSRQIKKIN